MGTLSTGGQHMKTMTTIKAGWKHWIFPGCVLVATCFGVFVLPFFFPPPYLAGISVANVAGFNNKIAYISAALISALVFLAALKGWWVEPQQPAEPSGRISRSIVLTTTTIFVGLMALLSWFVVRSHVRYVSDAGYFIEQIRQHSDFGRKLYEQIEFPYGPLIFYGPIVVRAILSPLHVSLTGAYYITLLLEHFIGLMLVAYVIDSLPMLSKWKTLLFVVCALISLQINFGLNYTFFRFIIPPAFLVLATKRKRPWSVATCFLAGQMTSLALSPEMAFAFGAASVVYGLYFCYVGGRTWLIAVLSPFIATAGFLLLVGRGYLLMLKLFAKGILNFVVEPLPFILTFLFALVWLVPRGVAFSFRQKRIGAPGLAALYIFSLALLPVAFGRADAGHVFFNGLSILLLSMVTISSFRPRQQIVWAVCIASYCLWVGYPSTMPYSREFSSAILYGTFHSRPESLKNAAKTFVRTGSLTMAKRCIEIVDEDHSFDVEKLKAIIGDAKIATPIDVSLYVEEALKRAGQYTPSYYCSLKGVYNATAEDRAVQELNESQWALLPGGVHIHESESPADTRFALGIQLPYRAKHDPYVIGDRFNENLLTHWQPYGQVGSYIIYRRR